MSEIANNQKNSNETNRNDSANTGSNTVTIEGKNIKVVPNGLNKLWSFKGNLEIPLAHVAGATVDPGFNMSGRRAFRNPGLATPGKRAGTFKFPDGDTEFWNIKQPEQPLVIQLRDEKYDRLVLGVHDPRQVADAINAVIE
ncbi:hypothetical protein OZX57_03650 [Bifidobacterium sp. ESL0682]|uniref:hypothetical protein n=1 Tax=Bifidobacterium sp. ESL0682 TaxID=2983212 RepID=UPI0023F77F80|nr:hypothetical protein [Bifidobacterium sp. ESL0682]WEV42531.1 hypothetical protein OZX57_03650 [Bifidobacterium sp. ESL0682]